MHKLKYIFIFTVLILVTFFCSGLLNFTGSAQTENEVGTACYVLAKLSQDSRNWKEIVAYRNAFAFLESHVSDRASLSSKKRYFDSLASSDSDDTRFCMFLNKEPKKCTAFRNVETDDILELVEKRMREDNLSKDDILDAIKNIKSKKNPAVFVQQNKGR